MFYPQQLRVQIQERRNRLFRSGFATYQSELRYFLQFLHDNHYTRALLTTLDAPDPLDIGKWLEGSRRRWGVQFPDSEVGRARVCYSVLKECVTDENPHTPIHWGMEFSSKMKLEEVITELNEMIVEPFVNFLHDQIDDGGNVLYLAERFKLKAEWFRRKELFGLYEADTTAGERNLDLELRAGLFDAGIDYPFSQPASPSGQADVIALLESDDPLVLEIKVFDPERNRGKRHIRQGFQQILRYAQDYNKDVGYLVIFNCSANQLVISPEETSESEFPPRIAYSGKTFFVIPIDIHPDVASASRENPNTRSVVSLQDVVGE